MRRDAADSTESPREMSKAEVLRGFVTERLAAASQEILAAVDRIVAEYEEEASGFRREIARQRRLLEAALQPRVILNKTDVQHLLVSKEKVPPELSPGLDQEDPESPHIKAEQEELWSSQEGEQLQGLEEADDTKVPLTAVDVKSPHIHLQPDVDEEVSDSSETEDSEDDWKETRAPELGLKINEVHVSDTGSDTDEETFSCSECGKRFRTKLALQSHVKIHTEMRPYGCDVCGRRFKLKSHVKTHMTVHTGEKPFGCSVCDKRFKRLGQLTVHIKIHTGGKPYGCDVCGKRFKLQTHIKRHMTVHREEKPFGCSLCQKTFKRKDQLKLHMRIHTGEKPHGCGVCGKTFAWQGGLKVHMRLHTGEKPHGCGVCGKKFVWQDALKVHMRGHTVQRNHSTAVAEP
ncbi:zinc finger protein 664-like isoform X3 [Trachinotus anak]|uniref:zinc finger protein 664-like isoform X3 n=1 Tax=Trachinotus anak TaxID=443729 RepID=UPI0039F1FAE5